MSGEDFIKIEDYKPLKKISDAIKYKGLNPFLLNDVDIEFKITEGKVYVEPFTNKIGDSKVTIAGSNSFDQIIDYTFSFEIDAASHGHTIKIVESYLCNEDPETSRGTETTVQPPIG